MKTETFNELLDSELEKIIHEKELSQKFSQIEQAKTHAFMNWFLNFYAKGVYDVHDGALVDGSGDSSCDIIFSKRNPIEQKFIFYVVQSKWNQKK